MTHVRQLKQTAKDNITFFSNSAIQSDLSFAVAFRQRTCGFLPKFYQQSQIQHNVFVTLK